MSTDIDIAFDFRSDTPPGKDPDRHSKTLRRYHTLLWTKALPSGAPFELKARGGYFHYRSERGEIWLSSDTVIPTFDWEPHIQRWIPKDELDAFNAIGYTIGGMMVFPAGAVRQFQRLPDSCDCRRVQSI